MYKINTLDLASGKRNQSGRLSSLHGQPSGDVLTIKPPFSFPKSHASQPPPPSLLWSFGDSPGS